MVEMQNLRWGSELVKRGFAKMQKGGVIMDVTDAQEASIAEEAGAVAVMALERVPADIREEGGVARMSDPGLIEEIIDAVSIPVMAKCRIGHFAEAQALEAIGVDMIDESEVLTPADPYFHVFKDRFQVPFVCGATQLGEAIRRIAEGAAMMRTKGEAGSGDIVEAVRHRRLVSRGIQILEKKGDEEIDILADVYAKRYLPLNKEALKDMEAGEEDFIHKRFYAGIDRQQIRDEIRKVLVETRDLGRLPVVDFTAGGIATPMDAALMMQMGSDGVFVGSGIFKSDNPKGRAKAIVEATTHFDKPDVVAEVSKNLGTPMVGRSSNELEVQLAGRGI